MSQKAIRIKSTLNAPAEEAYKVLRSNIQFCSIDKRIKTLAITSCSPGEGKTTTAINLAISMARASKRVLLVDTDLRKPMLAKYLTAQNTMGLTNYISGQVSIDDIICSTTEENFYFIGCGPVPPNPAEMVSSETFKRFVEAVQKDFDIVIFDTPPLGNVIDSAIISSYTDGTLIVIKSKSVDFHLAQRVKEQLENANAKILGVVLNRLKKSEYKGYYSNYKYYGNNPSVANKKFNIFKLLKRAEV